MCWHETRAPCMHQVREKKSYLARLETIDAGKPISESEWDMVRWHGWIRLYRGCMSWDGGRTVSALLAPGLWLVWSSSGGGLLCAVGLTL